MTKKFGTKFGFISSPSIDSIIEFEKLMEERRIANHKKRESKLIKYLPSLSICKKRGYSLAKTSNFLKFSHGISFAPSTISRFLKSHNGLFD